MKEFPPTLNVKNENNFPKLYYNRVLCYLRRDLYEHILREDGNNYFALDTFASKYKVSDVDISTMREIVIKELENLGWNTKLSFNYTGLFIYSTDEVPRSCW